MVEPNAKAPAGLAGKVQENAKRPAADRAIKPFVLCFQIIPKLNFLCKVFLSAGTNEQDRRNGLNDLQVIAHVLPKPFMTTDLGVRNHIIDHKLVHADLLVHSRDHDGLIHGLILAANVIAIKIHVEIIHSVNKGERLEHVKIVHVERVLRKAQPAVL